MNNILSFESPFLHNAIVVKDYGDLIKVVNAPCVRNKGSDFPVLNKFDKLDDTNTEKILSNIIRARSKVKEYVMCNDWDYFCTFTINKEYFNRFDLDTFYKSFSKFINNYNRGLDIKVSYLFVPEMHKNGAWHLHGVIKGIKESDLFINEYGYLSWRQYNDKFGFIQISPIKSKVACSNYIAKYISKDLCDLSLKSGAHLYYHSRGLSKAETIMITDEYYLTCDYDFECMNGFVKIKYFDKSKENYLDYLEAINVVK